MRNFKIAEIITEIKRKSNVYVRVRLDLMCMLEHNSY